MSKYGLSNKQIGEMAPAALQESPADVVSDKYSFIPTVQVVNDLRNQGWYPVRAQQAAVRNTDREGFQKHLITFRNKDTLNTGLNELGDSVPEILLTNSHDARNAFSLWAGIFRMICSNGMVVADETAGKIRLTHRGYDEDALAEALGEYTEALPKVIEGVVRFKEIDLEQEEQVDFAEQAYELAYANRKTSFDPVELLTAQRDADKGDSLWKVFNRVQENIIRPGIVTVSESGRKSRTRGVKAIDSSIAINTGLYSLANEFAGVAG